MTMNMKQSSKAGKLKGQKKRENPDPRVWLKSLDHQETGITNIIFAHRNGIPFRNRYLCQIRKEPAKGLNVCDVMFGPKCDYLLTPCYSCNVFSW